MCSSDLRNLKDIAVTPEDNSMESKKTACTEHMDAHLEAASGIKQEGSLEEKEISGTEENKGE